MKEIERNALRKEMDEIETLLKLDEFLDALEKILRKRWKKFLKER